MEHPIGVILLFVVVSHQGTQAQPQGPSPFLVIQIIVSDSQLEQLKDVDGTKAQLQKARVVINGDPVVVNEVHARGTSSLNFIRKSLSVDLEHAYPFKQNDSVHNIKKFDLLNLVMDKNLWHNRWAFRLLGELGIFPAYNTFCTLWINGQPQGIYLLVEKPNHAGGRLKSPYMIRRTSYHKIKHEYAFTDSKDEVHAYRQRYHDLYSKLPKLKGQELQRHLEATLDLDHYFEWLAFNYLIMNGDYCDELYFYIKPPSMHFDIVPWDYDDIFARAPHEGHDKRNTALSDRLLFSLEDNLDRAIAADPATYAFYYETFRKLLDTLNEDFLASTLRATLEELETVAADVESAKASRFHDKEEFDRAHAREDVRMSKSFLVKRRSATIRKLQP